MGTKIERDQIVILAFIILFGWVLVTTILGWLSGWFKLMTRFPDEHAEPILIVRRPLCWMGLGISMSAALTVRVSASGIKISMLRIFGPFCRPFFVPWTNITAVRKNGIFWPEVQLQFGKPIVGTLNVSTAVAAKMARAAAGRWPANDSRA